MSIAGFLSPRFSAGQGGYQQVFDGEDMSDQEVLFERQGPVGLITMNRPKALNALNHTMILAITQRLKDWAVDDDIHIVVIRGTGNKAFCAGGDVKEIYHAGLANDGDRDVPGAETYDYFFHEYRLNTLIRHYPKPYVALMDGIVMGGGVGVSIHGSHRIVTENTMFAMPETGIGLFTDIGAGYFLPRFPGETGTYIGLTGDRLGAHDCLYTGVGTHYVTTERMDEIVAKLARGEAVDDVLATFVEKPKDHGHIKDIREQIDTHFTADSVEEIVESLAADSSEWAQNTHAHLLRMCPRSMKYTLRLHREGRDSTFDADMVREFRLSQACMRGPDYYEGIRALLIDKDKSPKWQPDSLLSVTDGMLDAAFAAPKGGDIHFDDLLPLCQKHHRRIS